MTESEALEKVKFLVGDNVDPDGFFAKNMVYFYMIADEERRRLNAEFERLAGT